MEINEKLRKYKGENTFALSLQKQLKTSKYLDKVEVDGKIIKVFTDKQYDAAKNALS